MATPPTIAGLEPDEIRGDVMRLLPPLEKALRANAACLSRGLTLADNVMAYIREVEFTVPDDWVTLTALNGFASSAGWATLAVRKSEDGEVEIREAVDRPAGAPAVNTVIANLPVGYEPAFNGRRVAEASVANVLGGWTVNTDATVRWLFGNPVAPFFFSRGSWVAADRRPATWATPLTLDCTVQWDPAYVRVLSLRYAGERTRRATGAGPVIWREVKQVRPGVRRLEIQRIMGLAPTQKYTMTLGVFPE